MPPIGCPPWEDNRSADWRFCLAGGICLQVIPEKPTTVLVADDHPLYRNGLLEAIGKRSPLELVGEAETGREALEKIRKLRPDVAVLDMKMPGLDGIEVLRAVRGEELETKILFLSAYLESATVYEAVEAGARGYISKDSDAETVCDAIAAVARGETIMGSDTAGVIAEEIRVRAPTERGTLSQREREILLLTADGHSAAVIAGKLYLSPATVKTHLQRIYQKLGVSDRAAAVAEAMRRGLFE
jgi:two-component system nitrate/nitrite response regulator NarL